MKTCYELVGLELGPMSEKLGQSLNRRTAVREIPIRGLHNNVLIILSATFSIQTLLVQLSNITSQQASSCLLFQIIRRFVYLL